MGSSTCSRPRWIGLVAAGLMAAGVLAAAGCAGRGRGTPRPDVGAQGEDGHRAAPATGVAADPGSRESGDRGREQQAETVILPGQNRWLPSQDPRNQAGSGELAPEDENSATPAPVPPPPEPVKADPQASASSFTPPPIPPGEDRFRVQVLASAVSINAYRVRGELEETLGQPVYVEQEQGILKVRAGDFRDRVDADTLRRRLFGLGYGDAFVVESRGR
jgi:hypothetical protein